MLFYIFVILLSVFLFVLAEKSGKVIVFAIAIIPPLMVEGLRDRYIGTDMWTYAVPFFETLKRANTVFEVPLLIQHSDYAYLYLTYFCAKYIGDLNVFLTICALIKLVLVYVAAYRLRHQIPSALFVFSYYLYFYVLGFSLMRQSLAIAFCIFSLPYLFEKKILKFLILSIIAYFFHNSAILMLILPIVFLLSTMHFKYVLCVGIPLFLYLNIATILEGLISSPLFTAGKVEMYIDSGVPSEKTSILINIYFFLVGLFMLSRRKYPQQVFLLLSYSVYALIFLFLASYVEVAFRMSYYMLIPNIILLLFLIRREKIWILSIGFICVFIVHFFIASNYGLYDTLPYKSSILGI